MTGQSAKVAPLSMDWIAGAIGICQGPTAMTNAMSKAANEACQAGRRSTPSKITSASMGSAATQNEAPRLLSIGVNSWWNMHLPLATWAQHSGEGPEAVPFQSPFWRSDNEKFRQVLSPFVGCDVVAAQGQGPHRGPAAC